LEEKLHSIAQFLDRNPDKIFRIGTGEFTDSLALDPIAGWSDILIPFISKRKNAVLELKTKTDQIEGLFSSPYRSRIVVSWSLNSPDITTREEKGAPGIQKRLEAAKRCQAEGFQVGFHFDPLIQHPGWEDGYRRTLEMMDNFINPKGVIWVSLGGLRYLPALKSIIRKRHPKSSILTGEFIPGLDGKMRYFKPIRIEMYEFMTEMRTWDFTFAWRAMTSGRRAWGGLRGTPKGSPNISIRGRSSALNRSYQTRLKKGGLERLKAFLALIINNRSDLKELILLPVMLC
jgi:spore photoproduct lyase